MRTGGGGFATKRYVFRYPDTEYSSDLAEKLNYEIFYIKNMLDLLDLIIIAR